MISSFSCCSFHGFLLHIHGWHICVCWGFQLKVPLVSQPQKVVLCFHFQKVPKGHLENWDIIAQKAANWVNSVFPGLYVAHFPLLFFQVSLSLAGYQTQLHMEFCLLPCAKLCSSCMLPHLELCTTMRGFHLSPSKSLECSL